VVPAAGGAVEWKEGEGAVAFVGLVILGWGVFLARCVLARDVGSAVLYELEEGVLWAGPGCSRGSFGLRVEHIEAAVDVGDRVKVYGVAGGARDNLDVVFQDVVRGEVVDQVQRGVHGEGALL